MKTATLIIGASENPERTSCTAIQRLTALGHPVKAIGIKSGEVSGIKIETGMPDYTDIHTVSLYVNPLIQEQYYDYILSLCPERVIFNPGTENKVFEKLLKQAGITCTEACTLVLLSLKQY